MNYEILKTVSQILTYTGLSVSSILTWINLHFKTSQDPDAGHRKILTPAGKSARIFLVISFVITICSAIVQNYADSKLRRAAEQRGTKAIQAVLEEQHKLYVNDLTQQFEGPNGVIPKLGEQAKAFTAAKFTKDGVVPDRYNPRSGIQRGHRVLRGRIFIADSLKKHKTMDKWNEIVKYAQAKDPPSVPLDPLSESQNVRAIISEAELLAPPEPLSERELRELGAKSTLEGFNELLRIAQEDLGVR